MKKLTEIREWVTMVGTVLILPLGLWAWFTITQEIKLSVQGVSMASAQQYETKDEHASDLAKISAWTKTIQDNQISISKNLTDGQNEMRLSIQHISDTMPK